MRELCRTLTVSIFAAVLAAGTLTFAEADARSVSYDLDIPSEDLTAALQSFAIASHHKLLYKAELTAGKISRALKGHFTAHEAMEALLSGTGLSYEITGSSVVLIKNQPGGKTSELREEGATPLSPRAEPQGSGGTPVLLAQVNQGTSGPPAAGDDQNSEKKKKEEGLSEIVVTGTLISGVQPTSRVAEFSREDIQQQGFSTVQDFIQSIPQNFNGGASENTVYNSTGAGGSQNAVNATGINLRGLGNDATLVLLDGHRVAAGNTLGNFVDVSLIPVAALARVDVMADGASALYGSDAVGGVVNFVLRRGFDGQETTARYGSVTQGSRYDVQASQTSGHDWGSGSAMIVYSFDHTTPLDAQDRSFTQGVQQPYTLLPERTTNSVLLTAQQEVGNTTQLFGDAVYSNRSGDTDFNSFGIYHEPESIHSYFVTGGIRGSVSDNVNFEISPSYSKSDTHFSTYNVGLGDLLQTDVLAGTSILSVDAKLDGLLFSIPTGDVRFAAGGQFRRETYSSQDSVLVHTDFDASRTVSAGFIELHVPLMGSRDSANSAGTLELELADRQEHYSDFGNTNNPKVGLLWEPIHNLKLRANYSTSYVAPVLEFLNPVPSAVDAIPGNFAGGILGPGAPDSLFVFGGNPELLPQKSTNWTTGVDFKLSDVGVSTYVDYYHVSYIDRINNISALNLLFTAFQNESILGPSIVQRNPSPAYVQMLAAEPTFLNLGVANLATIGAVVDARELNLSAVRTSGLDFGISQVFRPSIGRFEVAIDGTYILEFDNKVTALSPFASFLNQAYNPIDLKLRGRGSFQRGPFAVGAYLNYVNSYHNVVNDVSVPVASWATLDMNASYRFEHLAKGTTLMLGVTNLTNKAPPYVLNTNVAGLNYDGANASALGRFLYVQIVTQW
jgi:iron complex outermembrane recepter protein